MNYATQCVSCENPLSGGVDTYGDHDLPMCMECWFAATDPANGTHGRTRCDECERPTVCEITFPEIMDGAPTGRYLCTACEDARIEKAMDEIQRDIIEAEADRQCAENRLYGLEQRRALLKTDPLKAAGVR